MQTTEWRGKGLGLGNDPAARIRGECGLGYDEGNGAESPDGDGDGDADVTTCMRPENISLHLPQGGESTGKWGKFGRRAARAWQPAALNANSTSLATFDGQRGYTHWGTKPMSSA